MTVKSNRSLIEAQRDVQWLMGYCILSLQEYELMMKGYLAEAEFVVTELPDGTFQVEPPPDLGYITLGGLVSRLLESVVTSHEKAEAGTPDDPSDTGTSVRIRHRKSFTEEDLVRTASDLKELVLLRNRLVHHFLAEHDLNSLAGCLAAENAVSKAADKINVQRDRLIKWVNDRTEAKKHLIDALNLPEVIDHLDNDIIAWHYTTIVKALREAAETLHRDGWTSVSAAQAWILARDPEELPEGYGCKSWRQVIRDCGLFELRYFVEGGTRVPWYRPSPAAALCASELQ
jgi:hypothetical protein